jgi:hypothetical protein
MFHDRSSHINMRFSAAAGVLLKPRFRNSSLFAIFSCQVAALSHGIGKFRSRALQIAVIRGLVTERKPYGEGDEGEGD